MNRELVTLIFEHDADHPKGETGPSREIMSLVFDSHEACSLYENTIWDRRGDNPEFIAREGHGEPITEDAIRSWPNFTAAERE